MASNDKAKLLEELTEDRLRDLASRWQVAITDRRVRGPGIAKLLAGKRSLSVADVVEVLTDEEARAAVDRLEVPLIRADPRATLTHHLTGSSWRAVRKAHADFTRTPAVLRTEVLELVDGDTLRVSIDGKPELVRLRGMDAPESRRSDKIERDLDRAGHDDETEFALGAKATAALGKMVGPGSLVDLYVERRPDGSLVTLQAHRLLAFVALAASQSSDIGLAMIEGGYALVWPRNKQSRRYDHPRIAEYLRACNAAFQRRPGLWEAGLARHCPAVQSGAVACAMSDCERTCSPGSRAEDGGA